ncbi:MAG TPA: hypothetical protein VN915_00915 [Elusimicrobiota bacterium]|nr:hypothetical protein [Elusimicrobiota bacterium]
MEYPAYPAASGPRVRWSSVLAGSALTVAVLASLDILGLGLGYYPAAAAAAIPSSVTSGAVPAGAWWTLGASLPAFFLGGWIASRLSDSGRRSDGVIFGLVSWAVSALTALYFPAASLGGAMTVAASGVFMFLTLLAQAWAAALGGFAGARLYLPVPAAEYRRHRRELVEKA